MWQLKRNELVGWFSLPQEASVCCNVAWEVQKRNMRMSSRVPLSRRISTTTSLATSGLVVLNDIVEEMRRKKNKAFYSGWLKSNLPPPLPPLRTFSNWWEHQIKIWWCASSWISLGGGWNDRSDAGEEYDFEAIQLQCISLLPSPQLQHTRGGWEQWINWTVGNRKRKKEMKVITDEQRFEEGRVLEKRSS